MVHKQFDGRTFRSTVDDLTSYLISSSYDPGRAAFSGMSSFFCMTDSTSGEGRRADRVSTSTRSSSPFPSGLFRRAWVGLWNVVLAHDFPLSFRSGVLSGAPQSQTYIETFLLSPHLEREATTEDSKICGGIVAPHGRP